MSSNKGPNSKPASDKLSSPSMSSPPKDSKELNHHNLRVSELKSPTPSPTPSPNATLTDSSINSESISFPQANSSLPGSYTGTIKVGGDPACLEASTHKTGQFCGKCRGIPMPWGSELPHRLDEDGNPYTTGPDGSILEGVMLQDSEAIAVISTMVSLNTRGFLYSVVPGLLDIMERYPSAVAAASKISRTYQTILRYAREEAPGVVPNYWDIVEAAMNDPTISSLDYVRHVLENFSAFSNGLQDISKIKLAGLDLNSGGENSESEGDDLQNTWKSRPRRMKNKTHAPGPKAEKDMWRFLDGTDLSPAVLGKPEPQKFILIRQHKVDPNLVDVREYTGIVGFDWDDKGCIDRLNKAMGQIKTRADPYKEKKHGPWTVKEKEALEALIIAAKFSSNPLDWDTVASDLRKNMQGQVQEKGSPLASTRFKNAKGVWIEPKKKEAKLSETRTGAPARNAGAVRAQAKKYPEIKKLLEGMAEVGPKLKKNSEKPTSWVNVDTDIEDTPAKLRSAKKNTIKRTESDDEDIQSPKKRSIEEIVSDDSNKESPSKKAKQSGETVKVKDKSKAAGEQESIEVDDSFVVTTQPITMPRKEGQKPARKRGKKNNDNSLITKPKDSPPPPPPASGAAA